MKNLNLSSYDVKEMNEAQMSGINGGWWWILGAIAYDIISNGPDSVRSFNAGVSYLYER